MKLSTKLILVSSAALVLCFSSSAHHRAANYQESELPLGLKIIRTNAPDETIPASKSVSTTLLYSGGLKMISVQAPKSPAGVEIQSKIERARWKINRGK